MAREVVKDVPRSLRLVASNGIPAPQAKVDVVATLASTTRFRTLLTLLVAAELIDDLRDAGPWVVFAPDDHAFDALPPGVLESWLHPGNTECLVDVAECHIAKLERHAPRGERRSLLNEPIDGSATRGEVISCTNGIVVVFDRVRLPHSLR